MGKSQGSVLDLSVAEKIQLAEDLWDSVASDQSSVKISRVERDELDRRLVAYKLDPKAGSSWEAVKKKLLRKR